MLHSGPKSKTTSGDSSKLRSLLFHTHRQNLARLKTSICIYDILWELLREGCLHPLSLTHSSGMHTSLLAIHLLTNFHHSTDQHQGCAHLSRNTPKLRHFTIGMAAVGAPLGRVRCTLLGVILRQTFGCLPTNKTSADTKGHPLNCRLSQEKSQKGFSG